LSSRFRSYLTGREWLESDHHVAVADHEKQTFILALLGNRNALAAQNAHLDIIFGWAGAPRPNWALNGATLIFRLCRQPALRLFEYFSRTAP
jgi:hypothetical protein